MKFSQDLEGRNENEIWDRVRPFPPRVLSGLLSALTPHTSPFHSLSLAVSPPLEINYNAPLPIDWPDAVSESSRNAYISVKYSLLPIFKYILCQVFKSNARFLKSLSAVKSTCIHLSSTERDLPLSEAVINV